MKKNIFTVLLLALLTMTCTEKISISPVYTSETDWAPELTSVTSGYGRMSLYFNSPTRLELFRVIEQYILSVKKDTESSYVPVDTNFFYLNNGFQTDSILAINQTYQARVSVHYRDGTIRYSNEITFHSPEIKGSILKRIPLSDKDIFEHDFPRNMVLGNGGFYAVFYSRKAVFIDTLSGDVTPISVEDYSGVHLLNSGSLVLTIYEGDNRQFRMDYYNSASLEKDSSRYVTMPQFPFHNNLHFVNDVQSYDYDGGDIIFLCVNRSSDKILVEFNIKTGDILKTSEIFFHRYSTIVLKPVGDQIWTDKFSEFMDMRISLITFDDPNILVTDFYSPIGGMAYFLPVDNAFWAYDWEKEALVKFLPEAVE